MADRVTRRVDTMTPEAWTIIGCTIVILVAFAGGIRHLRSEINGLRGEFNRLGERMHRLEVELRERMAKVEGLLEGLREALVGTRASRDSQP